MAVNYNDERFAKVESDKQVALSQLDNTYDGMIEGSDKFYQDQIDASKQYAKEQQKNQQDKTDFAIEKIEQQKEQTTKDYIKEQSGAYVDWQKESNRYGAGAEELAVAGMLSSGYSESSQVRMYTAYQNRVATARETYNKAVLNYDNAIKDAQLQNNSILAEIALNAQKEQLALSLEGFQYKNQLLLDKANKRTEIDNTFYARSQDVVQQINHENALEEEIRQFKLSQDLERDKLKAKNSNGIINNGSIEGSVRTDDYNPQPASIDAELDRPDTLTAIHGGGGRKRSAETNIPGHGDASKNGEKIEVTIGKNKTELQDVLRAQDGTLWYWSSKDNTYKQI